MTSVPSNLIVAGHGGPISALAFSADGKTLASSSYDHTAILWDVETGRMRRVLPLGTFTNDLILTPDGLTAVTDDGQVWGALTGRRLRQSPHYMAPLACSPDGRTMACPVFVPHDDVVYVRLLDMRTGRTRRQFPCCELQPQSIAFSSDGKVLAACGYDSSQTEGRPYLTTVCDLWTGETHKTLAGQSVYLFGVNMGPDARLVAVSLDGAQLWNAETGQMLKTVVEHSPTHSWVNDRSVTVAASGQLLAVGEADGMASVWDIPAAQCLWEAQAHRGWLRTMAFAPDGRTLATAGDDLYIRLWDAHTGTLIRALGGRGGAVEAVSFDTEGKTLTTLHDDGAARLWRIAPPVCERQESFPGVLAHGAPYEPDTGRNVWRAATQSLPTGADVPDGYTVSATAPEGSLAARRQRGTPQRGHQIAALSPDGSLVALHGTGSDIIIWDRDRRVLQCTLKDAVTWRAAPKFSPDNRTLAAGSDTGDKIRLFDVRTGVLWKELATGEANVLEVGRFAFSSDSRLLAAGHILSEVTLWDVRNGKRKRLLRAAQ